MVVVVVTGALKLFNVSVRSNMRTYNKSTAGEREREETLTVLLLVKFHSRIMGKYIVAGGMPDLPVSLF